jgi:signal transduction histidine kinase/ligand-binding sensor domain-containing protein/DNA-binding response OmpR family regulator
MRIHNLVKILVFFLVCKTPFFAQESYDNLNFESLTEQISNRAISSVIKDHKGVIWIGTQGDGLSSFNGHEFKNYRHEWDNSGSINHSIVNKIYMDSMNNLWVGTEEGLNLYNRNLDQFVQVSLDSIDSKTKVKAIEEIEGGKILVGTHGLGVFNVDIETKKSRSVAFSLDNNLPGFQVNDIKTTQRGAVLVGSNIGLLKYNALINKLDHAKFTTLKEAEIIKKSIQSILTKKDGSIWLGTVNNGLIEIFTTPTNYYEFKTHEITDKRILALEIDASGSIFCGTENDGLFILNNNGVKSLKYNRSNTKGIKSNSVWSVYIDESNRIWLGYFNQGIDIFDLERQRFKSIESIPNKDQSLFSKSVTSITQDNKNRLWFGIADGGIDVYDTKKQTFTHLLEPNNPVATGLSSADVVTVFIDSKNNTWVGTWNSGLFYLKDGSKKFKNIQINNSGGILKSNRIMSFAEDSKGNIWIGSFLSGLYSYNLKRNVLIHHQEKALKAQYIDSKNIRKVLVDRDDNIWLGTRTGLFKVSKMTKNPKVKSYNDILNNSLKTNANFNVVSTLFEDYKNNIWIGTDGYGLCQLNPKNQSVEWYNTTNNFSHQSISSIVQTEKNRIWITGNEGVSKFDVNKKTFTNYNVQDGLLASNFNKNSVYFSDDGVLYFGCYKGVNFFNPKGITSNPSTPTVFLSDFKLANKSIKPGQDNSPLEKVIGETSKLALNYNQSLFTIDFYGLSYTRSKNIEYAYYLEGFESDWNYVGKTRNATYTNIPPGNYKFKVKAANSDGIWNTSPTTLEIRVTAPWWKTNLATFIFFSLFLGIIITFYRFLNIRIKERLEIKRAREERKQIEGLNAKKIQFFTNISHEFRTPLTLILNPLEDIVKNNDLSLPDAIQEKHKIIYKNSKRLSRLIDELMDFRKLQFSKIELNVSKFDLILFINEVASHFEEEAMQRNIILSVEHRSDKINIWADPSMLEKIIFNLLSNAFKATKDYGAVTLKVQETSEPIEFPLIKNSKRNMGVIVSISDSGIGIKEENLKKIFSRFYQVNEMDEQYYGGTGIGLEVVKNFVDLHKGNIDVKSQKNVGTIFTISLPKGKAHFNIKFPEKELNVDNPNFKQINANTSQNEENLKSINISFKKTILIVEDNIELRNYVKNELQEEYKIKTAENGKEGLEKALKFVPDLIITDIMMPIMDGLELCEKIKTNFKISHIPLLMMTAKGMQIDKIKGINNGADAYVTKPFNMELLKSQIKQLISSRQILFNKYFNGLKNLELSQTTSLDKQFITNVLEYINKNISDSNLSVENLAEELLLSRSKLYRKIKALTGDTATEFIRNVKLEKAKELLVKTDFTVSEISYKVGFSSPSYFTKCFKNHFGVIPKEIRESNKV